jgi:hypothetical protein
LYHEISRILGGPQPKLKQLLGSIKYKVEELLELIHSMGMFSITILVLNIIILCIMIEMNLIYKSTYLLFCGTLDWRFGALFR